jgi:3-dehydroquinate dehydratase/shikimate dehydrogenase
MKDPQLCVAVTGTTMEEIRRNRDAAEGADLIEMRLDTVDHPDVAGALEGRRRPVIVTCRAAWEGGYFRGPEEDRRTILEQAISLGAEFIDVEARASFAPGLIRARRGRGVILSSHFFDGMPPDLADRWRALRSSGAEVPKLAVAVRSLSETLQVMALADQTSGDQDATTSGHLLIAMGEAGVASRVLSSRLRNRWTYAGQSVAPGQYSPRRLLGEFRFRELAPDAAIYGVAGNPVGHSLSPAMHNAGFAHFGLSAVYLPLEASDAPDFVRFARAMNLSGASVTAPFKVALMEEMDALDALASRVGALNTIVVREGRWHGANTDVHGFSAPLVQRMKVKGVRASILGAGGAARAVAVALSDLGASVTVCARRPDRAAEIADLAGGRVGEFPPRAGSWDVLVNTTPAGHAADRQSPIDGAVLDGEIVFDLIYSPRETRLLAEAKAAGCMTIGGLEMLVAQAERQFELWTGHVPPPGLFQQAADRAHS